MPKKINPLMFIILSFLAVISIGTLLLMLPISAKNEPASLLDALFTAASATTVTGLVVKDTATYWSWFGKAVILLLIQIGGLGYMTVMSFLAVIAGRMSLGSGVLLKEQLSLLELGDIFKFAKRVFWIVLLMEGIGAVLLFFFWMQSQGVAGALVWAVFHSISAFNNAGFDLTGNFQSFTKWTADFGINITIMLLIIIGGLGFIVINEILSWFKKEKIALSLHTKIVLATTVALIIGGAVMIFSLEYSNQETLAPLDIQTKILASFFQSVTARTAGFNTIDIGGMTAAGLLVLVFLMFIGASPGGTGGGVKTSTFAAALATIISSAQSKDEIDVFGRRINPNVARKACIILLSGIGCIFVGSTAISMIEQLQYLDILFEATSAFGVVGLSKGITPLLHPASKIILILLMFIGRIGPLAILLALFAKPAQTVHLPEEHIAIS